MRSEKGQAAMEYLMTYGWAILVIVIVLAALLYLGTFSLATKAPELCRPQVGLHCTSWRLDASDDNVAVTIINGYQKYMNVTRVLCQTQGTTGTWTDYANGVVIAPQMSAQLTVNGCYDADGQRLFFKEGDMFTGKLIIDFYFMTEDPSMTRRNIADVKFTAQP